MMRRIGCINSIILRRPADAKPTAGTFDCTKASNPTEVTICGDFDLASWDQSVSARVGALLKGHPAAAKKILASQQDYIRKRNACKTDKACIDYIQQSWVDLLVDERNSPDALIEDKDPVEAWQKTPDAGVH